jgi:hypothetical protein
VLGDFLGLERGVLGAADRRECLRSASRSRSPEIRRDPVSFSSTDFPPLSAGVVSSSDCGSLEISAFKLQVGSWFFEVPSQPSPPVASPVVPSPPPDLEGFQPTEESGDVDACSPRSSGRERDPSVSLSVPPGVVDGARPTLAHSTLLAQPGKPVNGPARLGLLFSPVLKWAWRPVGTLDSSFAFSASMPDLQRACLPPFHTRVLLLPQSARAPPMDRGRRDNQDGWEGRQNLKRPYEETLPLEERRVDSLS